MRDAALMKPVAAILSLTTPEWAGIPADPGTRNVVATGMRVLFDRDGALRRLTQEIDPGAAGHDR